MATLTRFQQKALAKVIEEHALQTAEAALDWASANLWPEDIYCDADLEAWAERHGYAKTESK